MKLNYRRQLKKCLKEGKEYQPYNSVYSIGFTRKEAKMLIYWACVGIAKSQGGYYEKTIPKLLVYFSKKMRIILPYKPEFNSKIKKYQRKKKKLMHQL